MPWVVGWWRGRGPARDVSACRTEGDLRVELRQLPGGGAAPTSVGEAPRSGAGARRHLGAHRRDPAGTPPLAEARSGASTPRNARRSRGSWMPAARAGGSSGGGARGAQPTKSLPSGIELYTEAGGGIGRGYLTTCASAAAPLPPGGAVAPGRYPRPPP